jgi:2-C-methyl-D-erythritol 4-phosphate cytidylyltransferase
MSTEPTEYDEEQTPALGQVPTTGRGALPFLTLDGEPLVLLAAYALQDAGVELVDFNRELGDLLDRSRELVFHDPLCPLTPPAFLAEAVGIARREDAVVVGVHPMTDTVKAVDAGRVGATVDREGLWSVASPVVLPASLVERMTQWPDADDMAALVGRLREVARVRFLEAPPLARRVDDESSLALLQALAREEAPSRPQP